MSVDWQIVIIVGPVVVLLLLLAITLRHAGPDYPEIADCQEDRPARRQARPGYIAGCDDSGHGR